MWDLREDALLVQGELCIACSERAHPGHVRRCRDPCGPDHVLVLLGVELDHLVVGHLHVRVLLACLGDLAHQGTVRGPTRPTDQLGVLDRALVLCRQLSAFEPAKSGDGNPVIRDPVDAMTGVATAHEDIVMTGGGGGA